MNQSTLDSTATSGDKVDSDKILSDSIPGDAVLAQLLEDHAVPMHVLHERYDPVLKLVRILIGVVPNCDRYLEIWPPAFRTYNIIVPNFLNLPSGIFGIGGAPKDIVGLGLYVSSRTAECPYCSAHTCSYALRRGATPEKMAKALVGGSEFTQQELATIGVARSLARIPCELTAEERSALLNCFTPAQAEWVVLGIVMMGFLNKFMDATGVELEASTVAETKTILGKDWSAGAAGRALDNAAQSTQAPNSDSLRTKLSVVRYAPAALRLDKKWQHGVPDTWPAVGEYLHEFAGHDFPVLSRMHNARGIRAVASALRENLNKETSVLGLDIKALAGVVFATVVADSYLADEARIIGRNFGCTEEQLDMAERFALNIEDDMTGISAETKAILQLARAASPSPAKIDNAVLNACRESEMSAQAIVELITWLSVLQMLHRLCSFYTPDPKDT